MEGGSLRTSSLCQNILHRRRSHWTSKRHPVSLVSSQNTHTITHYSMNSSNQRWNFAVMVWVLLYYHKTLKGVNGWRRWELFYYSTSENEEIQLQYFQETNRKNTVWTWTFPFFLLQGLPIWHRLGELLAAMLLASSLGRKEAQWLWPWTWRMVS